jgi:hypothetical protein
MKKQPLTPTQISVMAQPIDCVIQLVGEGPYKGQYVVYQETDGYLQLTTDVMAAHKLCNYDAQSVRSRLGHNAQFCYGGKFDIVRVA